MENRPDNPDRVDARRSPFYAWLDSDAIRELARRAIALPAGERVVLIKALIPSLVADMGVEAAEAFFDELRTKATRYAEALGEPGVGGASRSTPGELLGGPVPGGEVHTGEARNPRRPGGRALEREWEALLWEQVEGEQDVPHSDDLSS